MNCIGHSGRRGPRIREHSALQRRPRRECSAVLPDLHPVLALREATAHVAATDTAAPSHPPIHYRQNLLIRPGIEVEAVVTDHRDEVGTAVAPQYSRQIVDLVEHRPRRGVVSGKVEIQPYGRLDRARVRCQRQENE